MKGSVEIYQSYGAEDKLLFSEDNLIVDGGREMIASMMAHRNQVSAIKSGYATTGSDSVSSFQINALTLGPAKDYFAETLTRWTHDISGYGPRWGEDVLSGHGNFFTGTDGWHRARSVPDGANFYPVTDGSACHMSSVGTGSKWIALKEDFPDGIYKISFCMSSVSATAPMFVSEGHFGSITNAGPPTMLASNGYNEFVFRHYRDHGQQSQQGAQYNRKIQIGMDWSFPAEIWLSSVEIRRMDDDRHTLLPMKDRDFFEIANPPRAVGPNQWEYLENLQGDTKLGPNVLTDSSLETTSENWIVDDIGGVERTEHEMSTAAGTKLYNKFTHKAARGRFTVRQKVPIKLGSEYTFKLDGRSNGLPIGVKLYRGVNEEKRQYLDFDTGKWVHVLSPIGEKAVLGEDVLGGRGAFDDGSDWYESGFSNQAPEGTAPTNVSSYCHLSGTEGDSVYTYTTSASYTGSRRLRGHAVLPGRTYRVEFDAYDIHTGTNGDGETYTSNICINTDWYNDFGQGTDRASIPVNPGRNVIDVAYPRTGYHPLSQTTALKKGSFYLGKQKDDAVNLKIKNLIVREVKGKTDSPTITKHITLDNTTFDSKSFRFKLEGYSIDQSRLSYKNYWLELDLPSKGFIDDDFDPMSAGGHEDKYADIFDVALYDHDKQILKNPNFNKRDSFVTDGEFTSWYNFEDGDSVNGTLVPNPGDCNVLGIAAPTHWNHVSPRTFQELPLDATGYGSVRKFTPLTTQGTHASGYTDGVVLSVSSVSGTAPGYAEINQTVYLDNSYSNWIIQGEQDVSDQSRIKSIIETGSGFRHLNGTAMLTFDFLANPISASGLGSAALTVELTRIRDGQKYCFHPTKAGDNWKRWTVGGVDASAFPKIENIYPKEGWQATAPAPKDAWIPNTWHRFCANVEFDDPLAGEEAYKIKITGAGVGTPEQGHSHTTGPYTFVDYFIRNLSFGRLSGWDIRTFGIDNETTSGTVTNAMLVPEVHMDEKRFATPLNYLFGSNTNVPYFDPFEGSRDVFVLSSQTGQLSGRSGYNADANNWDTYGARTSLTQRFSGLQPRKKYQINIKLDPIHSVSPQFRVYLRAYRGGLDRKTGFNLLRKPAAGVPGPGTEFNEFGKGTDGATTNPYGGGDSRIKADQNSLRIPKVKRELFYANAGTKYFLECESYRESSEKGYLALSSVPIDSSPVHFWNWENNQWDTPTSPTYGDPQYFLPLGGHNDYQFHTDYSPGSVSPEVTFYSNSLTTTKSETTTSDGLGRIGDYQIAANIFATSSTTDSDKPLYVKKLKLLGNAEDGAKTASEELWYDFINQSWETSDSTNYDIVGQAALLPEMGFHASSVDAAVTLTNMHSVGLTEDAVYVLDLVDVNAGSCAIREVSITDSALSLNDNLNPDAYRADIFTSESEGNLLDSLGLYLKEKTPGTYVWLENNGTKDGTVHDNTPTPSGVVCRGVIPRSTIIHEKCLTLFPTPDNPDYGRYHENLPYASIGPWRDKGSGTTDTTLPIVTFHDRIGNLGVKVGEQLAFGIDLVQHYGENQGDFQIPGDASNPIPNIPVNLFAGTIDQGRVYFYDWNTSQWLESKAPFMKAVSGGIATGHRNDVSAYTHILSPKIQVPPFSQDADILFGVHLHGPGTVGSTTETWIRTLKKYRVTPAFDWFTRHLPFGNNDLPHQTSGTTYRVSSNIYFPEFPNPTDTTLQPTSPGAGELGHFMNRAQWFNIGPGEARGGNRPPAVASGGAYIRNNVLRPSQTGERDWEEAVQKGAFIPSAGYYFPDWVTGKKRGESPNTDFLSGIGYVSGVLNKHQSVNSDGYIYKVPGNHSTHTYGDASAGLVVSSVRDTRYAGGETSEPALAGAKELRYIMRITKDQWRVMEDIYGGVGAMGLHGINWDKTIDKLGPGPFLAASGTHTGNQGVDVALYNQDPVFNPVFQLFSKKVMFPPGLHIDYENTDYLTIIWKIRF